MIGIKKQVITRPVCVKCNHNFRTEQSLQKHMLKKIPCDQKNQCDKCKKVFKKASNLLRHANRKTPCNLIKGDPTVKTTDTQCLFCRQTFSNKYSVKTHYNICKIKKRWHGYII
jgi:hypothetical protein